MSLLDECTLSFYEELTTIYESEKSKVILVKHNFDNKIYVKKVVSKHNKDIYNSLKHNHHKNISRIYEVIEDENNLNIICEYINGDDLGEILRKKETLDENKVREYVIQICDALNHIHNLPIPIIHRDIKPSNIILNSDGIIKVIDFDAARNHKDESDVKKDTVLLGTAGFAAPEQYGFGQTDCRSDIYSVGILINYLLTGSHPTEKLYKGDLTKVIEKCTNMLPENRYKNILELKNDLLINKNFQEDKVKNVETNNERSFSIPGFRTKDKRKMALSTIGYLALLNLILTMEHTTNYPILEKIVMASAILLIIAYYTDYMGVKKYFVFTESNDKRSKLIANIINPFLILFFCVFIQLIIEEILDIF